MRALHNPAIPARLVLSINEEDRRRIFDNVQSDSRQIIVSHQEGWWRFEVEGRKRKTERGARRGRESKRESYPRISQPATPQMKHTWVVLDLARIIPHPRLSYTHRANTSYACRTNIYTHTHVRARTRLCVHDQ